jgi:hypothetical protein
MGERRHNGVDETVGELVREGKALRMSSIDEKMVPIYIYASAMEICGKSFVKSQLPADLLTETLLNTYQLPCLFRFVFPGTFAEELRALHVNPNKFT